MYLSCIERSKLMQTGEWTKDELLEVLGIDDTEELDETLKVMKSMGLFNSYKYHKDGSIDIEVSPEGLMFINSEFELI